MDTMTNIVGILIITLLVVNVNVSRALRKISSDLPAVSIEQLDALRAEAAAKDSAFAKSKAAIDELQEKAASDQKVASEIEQTVPATEGTTPSSSLPDLELLTKQLEAKKAAIAAQKTEFGVLLGEQQRLKGILDSTPTAAPAADKIVRIPNSRPLPEHAKLERYLVTKGELFYLDVDGAKKRLLQDFQGVRSRMEYEKVKGAKGAPKHIYDQQKVVEYFEQRHLTFQNLDLRVPYNKLGTRVNLEISAHLGSGEPIEKAGQFTAAFQSHLRRIKSENGIVWFYVMRNAFETYLRAREICDATGVSAGWETIDTPVYYEPLVEFDVNQMEFPPPPPPGPPVAPPSLDQIVIPLPTKKLD